MNQCDGCRRGLPLRGHLHYEANGHSCYMACTAERYKLSGPPQNVIDAERVVSTWFAEHGHSIWMLGDSRNRHDPAPTEQGDIRAEDDAYYKLRAAMMQQFKQALAWGYVYGPTLGPNSWDRMRDSMAAQFTEAALKTGGMQK